MTAKDLLYQLLEYTHTWSSSDYTDTVSVKVREARIHALQEAFGISKKYANSTRIITYNGVDRVTYLQSITDLDYLLQGEFLHDRPLEHNSRLLEKMRAELPGKLKEFPIENRDMDSLFLGLFSYRKKLFEFTAPGSGMKEGFSPGRYYTKHLEGDLNAILEANVHDIDQVLCLIFDPEQRDIPLEELVSVFNYDHTDLSDHDDRALNDY